LTQIWKFEALDSLFFRDSRPMNAGETVWIESQFPPTGRTLQGAVRTAILNYLGIPFEDYLNKKLKVYEPLREEIGDGDSIGRLALTGPILFRESVPLFPVSLDLMKRHAEGKDEYCLLKPADLPISSDLGNIRFPAMPAGKTGYKPLSDCYVDLNGMQMLLKSEAVTGLSKYIFPLISDNPEKNSLAYREQKMGLARNNRSRMAEEGMLYATAPLRPIDTLKIGLRVEKLSSEPPTEKVFIQRLGGEGKLAKVSLESQWPLPDAEVAHAGGRIRFRLICITPALMPEDGWLPLETVKRKKTDSGDIWPVEVSNCAFDIISACIGKPFKQGGWNHASRYPRELRSYVPAGSVYFCETDNENEDCVLSLHGTKIGRHTEYGFGMVLVGRW
jgi:CRISPR-associated protein Cmr3